MKQIFVSFSIKEGVAVLEYHWDAFPFQFCSTPLYTLPFIALLKHSKIRDYLEVFTMIFVFIGGIANIAYPVQVYSTCLFLDIQTMVHHGLMVILAVYLAVYNRAKLKFNNYLGAFLVFIVMVCIAIALNELVFYTVDLRHYVFNMFFISRHFPCTLPILNLFINNLPYPVLLIVYIGGFVLLAWVLLVIYSAIINHHVKPCLPSFKFKKPKTQN